MKLSSKSFSGFVHYAEIVTKVLKPVPTITALLLVAIWTVALTNYSADNRRNATAQALQAANLAVAFEQQAFHTISEFDNLLVFSRELHASQSFTWDRIVNSSYAINKTKSYMHYLTITDADGNIIASTLDFVSGTPVNLSDREGFTAQKNAKKDSLFISKPVFGRLARQWVIHLTRPLRKPNGEFDGIIAVILPVDALTKMYSDVSLGNRGGIALLGDDGMFYAGTGAFAPRLGTPYREPQIVSTIPVTSTLSGGTSSLVESQIFDGLPRLVANRKVPNYPLSVMIATTNELSDEFFNGNYTTYFGITLLCTALLVLTSLVISRLQAHAKASLEQRNAMEIEKKVAEASASDRSLFLAVMSHEIRTPLNGVLGALDLMRGASLDDRTQRCVNMATESSETLLKLIDDILLFSKSENSNIDLAQNPFSLDHLCSSLHKSLLSLTIVNKNRFKLEVCPQAKRTVIGDAHRLRQVLSNLINNANKFTNKGSISLRLQALSDSTDRLSVRISITDTGLGIPLDKQKLIFDRFQTLDATYTRRTDGTGLGLAICDQIIRAMGSQIKLESNLGQGSCFSFELSFPYAQSAEIPKADFTRSLEPQPSTKPLRILLAEDNYTNTYVATQLLTDAGHAVSHAANGRKAVDLALSQPFDLILMDISMPEMNGIEAIAAIRSSLSQNSAVHVIALTAHAVDGDEAKFLAAGMNGYLTKPIRKEVLLAAVNSLSHSKPLRQASNLETAAHSRPSPCEPPLVSLGTFADFVRDRPIEQALKTLQIFKSELKEKTVCLEEIIHRQDVAQLQAFAHSTIGSGSMLGASRLVALSRLIEEECEVATPFDQMKTKRLLSVMHASIEEFEKYNGKDALTCLIGSRGLAA